MVYTELPVSVEEPESVIEPLKEQTNDETSHVDLTKQIS